MEQPEILNSVSDELREKIRKSFSMTLFIGAGVSASSGIPTFRGKGTGKYFDGQSPMRINLRKLIIREIASYKEKQSW